MNNRKRPVLVPYHDGRNSTPIDVLGGRLKKCRKRRKYTQMDLALHLCVDNTNISKWEKGVMLPNVVTLWKIAKALQVSVDYLIGLKDTKEIE